MVVLDMGGLLQAPADDVASAGRGPGGSSDVIVINGAAGPLRRLGRKVIVRGRRERAPRSNG
ncbi:hypothetical protein [Streptomyces sp. NBC_01538]|uniref:hypothetical protein n=1 Tax=Streptomyces sp. NBC_01538 TaxID=2903897 RepID=UPI00386F329B